MKALIPILKTTILTLIVGSCVLVNKVIPREYQTANKHTEFFVVLRKGLEIHGEYINYEEDYAYVIYFNRYDKDTNLIICDPAINKARLSKDKCDGIEFGRLYHKSYTNIRNLSGKY